MSWLIPYLEPPTLPTSILKLPQCCTSSGGRAGFVAKNSFWFSKIFPTKRGGYSLRSGWGEKEQHRFGSTFQSKPNKLKKMNSQTGNWVRFKSLPAPLYRRLPDLSWYLIAVFTKDLCWFFFMGPRSRYCTASEILQRSVRFRQVWPKCFIHIAWRYRPEQPWKDWPTPEGLPWEMGDMDMGDMGDTDEMILILLNLITSLRIWPL